MPIRPASENRGRGPALLRSGPPGSQARGWRSTLRAWGIPLGACLLAGLAVFALWRRQTRSDEQRYLDWVEGWRASRRQALEARGDSPLAGMRIDWAYYPPRPWGRQALPLLETPPAGTWGTRGTGDTALPAGRIVTLRGTDGSSIRFELAGYLMPTVLGIDTPRVLAAYRALPPPDTDLSPDEAAPESDLPDPGPRALLVPFYDATNRRETHPGGRYMDVHSVGGGLWQLDWNLAYAPYCAHRPLICPLPPESNRLPYPIRAGERRADESRP